MSDALVESLIVTAYIVIPLAVLAVLAAIADRAADRRWRQRVEPRITEHDFEDWRELVTDFFTERFIRHTRNRFAVTVVTGADPEKSEDRTAATVGPRTSKENENARPEK